MKDSAMCCQGSTISLRTLSCTKPRSKNALHQPEFS